jgi:serine/threonine-protein kinase HipA
VRLKHTFAALTAVCDAPALAGRELIPQLAFAYLIGNGDAHAKNFSVLPGRDGEWQTSPVYDVPVGGSSAERAACLKVLGDLRVVRAERRDPGTFRAGRPGIC